MNKSPIFLVFFAFVMACITSPAHEVAAAPKQAEEKPPDPVAVKAQLDTCIEQLDDAAVESVKWAYASAENPEYSCNPAVVASTSYRAKMVGCLRLYSTYLHVATAPPELEERMAKVAINFDRYSNPATNPLRVGGPLWETCKDHSPMWRRQKPVKARASPADQ